MPAATSSSNGSPSSNQESARSPSSSPSSSSSSSSSPSNSKRAKAAAAAALLTRPCFTVLPDVVYTAVVGFLAPWDVGSVLQLSTGVRAAVGPAIHSLVIPKTGFQKLGGSVDALIRLLRLCGNLQHLTIQARLDAYTQERALVHAIGSGSICSSLRSLRVPICFEDSVFDNLCRYLRAGRLPHLTELEVRKLNDDGDDSLVEALKVRRGLGLPRLTHLESEFGGRSLSRAWACCPPETVSHLHVCSRRLNALGSHLLAHPSFPALRSLSIGGWPGGRKESDGTFGGVLEAIDQGRLCALETLKLSGLFNGEQHERILPALVVSISVGKLPMLSSLELGDWEGGSDAVNVTLRALRKCPQKLRRFCLYDSHNFGASVSHVDDALASEDGALSQLEELEILVRDEVVDEAWASIPKTLAIGAPCASTLRSLHLCAAEAFTKVSMRPLICEYGRGAFPCLIDLTLEFAGWEDDLEKRDVTRVFAEALLALVARGSPSRLEKLSLHNKSLGIDSLDDLTPVFKGEGLPKLLHLSIKGNWIDDPQTFPEGWTALGSLIRLETLHIEVPFFLDVQCRYSQALADPAFCPFLRSVRGAYCKEREEDVVFPLETRRRLRELQVVAAAERERQQQRIAALEARVRELEAQLRQR